MTDPIALWQERLKTRVGMDDDERARMRNQLLTFCAVRGLRPAELLDRWEEHPELTVRRHPGATELPDPAVESFLVHNGIDVFGEIVCVDGQPADLATPGKQNVAAPLRVSDTRRR
jgi:hypothetical protein